MTEERRTRRPAPARVAAGGWIIGVTPGGRLEWVVPETSDEGTAVSQGEREVVEAPLGAEIVSAEEQALIEANREKIAELRTRIYPDPDLHDVISDIMGRAHPSMALAVAAWVLQATGLLPIPVVEGAVMAAGAVGLIGRQLGHRLYAEQVSDSTSEGATQLWQTHPGLAMDIVCTVVDRVIDSIKNAASVDDTELEDELDAFYPHWSRTDFEFDPRHYQR